MLGNVNLNLAKLSSIYHDVGNELSSAMQKIAAGKKYTQPSDDYVSFLQATNLQTSVTNYQNANGEIAQAKAFTDAGVTAGNQIYKDLATMQNLNAAYEKSADATQKISMSTQFDALAAQVGNEISNASVDGTPVIVAGALTTANLDGTATMAISPTKAPTAAAVSGLIGKIGAAAADTALDTSAGAVVAQTAASQLGLTSAYIGQMQGYGQALDYQTNLNNTIIASKTAAIKATSGIDDVAMLAKVTDLQVRQQAAISMMAQAHISQIYFGRLYGGGSS